MTKSLPALIGSEQTTPVVAIPGGHLLPALIADAGDKASWCYVDYFTSNIRNPNTRRASLRADKTETSTPREFRP